MQRNFVKYLLLFFIPVLLGYMVVEYLTFRIPSNYKKNSELLDTEAQNLEVLILGSSQMKDAVNAALLKQPTINLASGDQHHNTDFKILKSLLPKLKNLKTVVLEVSYSHFELPHNSKGFWKNSVYLKYYGVNCFERETYFKDKLIYLSFPPFYSKKLYNHYITKEDPASFNHYGFDTLNYSGKFKDLKYDEAKIVEKNFKINTRPDLEIFETNTKLFFEILDFLKDNNLNVIICEIPMYKSYLPVRHNGILKRRDSILQVASKNYKNVHLFDREEDTINFSVKKYWNESHLNPDGAVIYTTMFQKVLDSLH